MATAPLNQDLLAKLEAYFARPQGTAMDLKENPSLYRSGEYYDEATKRSYIQQRGSFVTPDGRVIGDGGTSGDAPPVSGFVGYDWEPGRYLDNVELNGVANNVFDAGGAHLYDSKFTGLKNIDRQNVLAPLLIMLSAFGATIAGAGAAGGAGAGAAGAAEAGATTFGVVDASIAPTLGATAPLDAAASLAAAEAYLPTLYADAAAAAGAGATTFGVVDTSIVPTMSGAPLDAAASLSAAEAYLPSLYADAAAAGGAVNLGTASASDIGTMYAGADASAASSLGGGASVAGGSALGSGKSLLEVLAGSPLASKLGQAALSALLTGAIAKGASDSGGGLSGGRITTSDDENKAAMPDPLGAAARRGYSDSLIEQLARRGRASTILTKTANGALGG